MLDLLPIVIPLLLVDVLNPVLLAATIYAVGTDRPYANSLALLCGHTAAYLLAGILIALGMNRITSYLANPGAVFFAIQIILGAALVVAGGGARSGGASRTRQPPGRLTPMSALLFGVVINFVGVPFALPYFAALDQLLKAELSLLPALIVLLVYNLLYVLPFLFVPIALATLGEGSRALLSRINDRVARAADWIMPKLLFVIGLLLVVDGIGYFWTGSPVF